MNRPALRKVYKVCLWLKRKEGERRIESGLPQVGKIVHKALSSSNTGPILPIDNWVLMDNSFFPTLH